MLDNNNWFKKDSGKTDKEANIDLKVKSGQKTRGQKTRPDKLTRNHIEHLRNS